jgi:hypothetical protein
LKAPLSLELLSLIPAQARFQGDTQTSCEFPWIRLRSHDRKDFSVHQAGMEAGSISHL